MVLVISFAIGFSTELNHQELIVLSVLPELSEPNSKLNDGNTMEIRSVAPFFQNFPWSRIRCRTEPSNRRKSSIVTATNNSD